jgi:hypothetical protein
MVIAVAAGAGLQPATAQTGDPHPTAGGVCIDASCGATVAVPDRPGATEVVPGNTSSAGSTDSGGGTVDSGPPAIIWEPATPTSPSPGQCRTIPQAAPIVGLSGGGGGQQLCFYDPAVGAPGSGPTGLQLARRASDGFTAPTPVVLRWPPGPSYVNFKTWLALRDWAPVTASASEAGLTATVTAVPEQAVWRMGPPDAEVVCDGPGRRYDLTVPDELQETDCGYTYTRSSAGIGSNNEYVASVTVTYRASWSATDGTGGALGTISRTLDFVMRVGEIQAINTRPT